jgi:hypothetical protein
MPASFPLMSHKAIVDRRDRRHRHRPSPPIGAAIKILPEVLDAVRIAADQAGDDMVAKFSTASSRPFSVASPTPVTPSSVQSSG